MDRIGRLWRHRTKHWLKIASAEWRFIETVAREDLTSTLATCEPVLAVARETGGDRRLSVAKKMDAYDGSELVPQHLLEALTAPLASYRIEYAFRLIKEWRGAAVFSIRQAKVSAANPETGVEEDRREQALNRCVVVWTERGLREAAQWWLAKCYSPDHMPQGVQGPVQGMAKLASLAPEGVPAETKAKVFAAGLTKWISEQHPDVSPGALPFVLTMEPTYLFNAQSFNAVKRNWLNRMTVGFAWALIGNSTVHETLTLANGSSYEGEHRNGKPDGYGLQTWLDGKRFKGGFRNGVPHGSGTMAWPDGNRLDSRWRKGRSYGVGTMTLKDGTWYRGEFRFGREHGKWIATAPDGRQLVSRWFLGKRVSTSRASSEDRSAHGGK